MGGPARTFVLIDACLLHTHLPEFSPLQKSSHQHSTDDVITVFIALITSVSLVPFKQPGEIEPQSQCHSYVQMRMKRERNVQLRRNRTPLRGFQNLLRVLHQDKWAPEHPSATGTRNHPLRPALEGLQTVLQNPELATHLESWNQSAAVPSSLTHVLQWKQWHHVEMDLSRQQHELGAEHCKIDPLWCLYLP